MMGGCVNDVIHDFQLIEEEASQLGLRMKTEIICDDMCTCDAELSMAPELQVAHCSELSILGSPIGEKELLSLQTLKS